MEPPPDPQTSDGSLPHGPSHGICQTPFSSQGSWMLPNPVNFIASFCSGRILDTFALIHFSCFQFFRVLRTKVGTREQSNEICGSIQSINVCFRLECRRKPMPTLLLINTSLDGWRLDNMGSRTYHRRHGLLRITSYGVKGMSY